MRTQLEHVPMPAHAEWTWLEAYGLISADPVIVHGENWTAAREAVAARLESLIPRAALDAELARSAAFADIPPAALIQRGSGWGPNARARPRESGRSVLPLCPLTTLRSLRLRRRGWRCSTSARCLTAICRGTAGVYGTIGMARPAAEAAGFRRAN